VLGQVSVDLKGRGFYEVDCCAKQLWKWTIEIKGSFYDAFDELLPTNLHGDGVF
jgi:hypothetical protein